MSSLIAIFYDLMFFFKHLSIFVALKYLNPFRDLYRFFFFFFLFSLTRGAFLHVYSDLGCKLQFVWTWYIGVAWPLTGDALLQKLSVHIFEREPRGSSELEPL